MAKQSFSMSVFNRPNMSPSTPVPQHTCPQHTCPQHTCTPAHLYPSTPVPQHTCTSAHLSSAHLSPSTPVPAHLSQHTCPQRVVLRWTLTLHRSVRGKRRGSRSVAPRTVLNQQTSHNTLMPHAAHWWPTPQHVTQLGTGILNDVLTAIVKQVESILT